MLFISHRGNLSGPQPENENKLSYIQAALDKGFAVEVDVIDFDERDTFTLGHDKGQEEVPSKYFRQKNLFAHAKNFKSLEGLLKHGAHCFYHTDEEYVLPELYPMKPWRSAYGICSDYVAEYRKEFEV